MHRLLWLGVRKRLRRTRQCGWQLSSGGKRRLGGRRLLLLHRRGLRLAWKRLIGVEFGRWCAGQQRRGRDDIDSCGDGVIRRKRRGRGGADGDGEASAWMLRLSRTRLGVDEVGYGGSDRDRGGRSTRRWTGGEGGGRAEDGRRRGGGTWRGGWRRWGGGRGRGRRRKGRRGAGEGGDEWKREGDRGGLLQVSCGLRHVHVRGVERGIGRGDGGQRHHGRLRLLHGQRRTEGRGRQLRRSPAVGVCENRREGG